MSVEIEFRVAVRGSQRGKTWTPAASATPPNAHFRRRRSPRLIVDPKRFAWPRLRSSTSCSWTSPDDRAPFPAHTRYLAARQSRTWLRPCSWCRRQTTMRLPRLSVKREVSIRRGRRLPSRKLSLEPLEDRRLLSVFTVIHTRFTDPGSLFGPSSRPTSALAWIPSTSISRAEACRRLRRNFSFRLSPVQS